MSSKNLTCYTSTYLDEFFTHIRVTFENNIALDDGNRTVSYSDLDNESNRLANILIEAGSKPSERICFMTSKSLVGYQ